LLEPILNGRARHSVRAAVGFTLWNPPQFQRSETARTE